MKKIAVIMSLFLVFFVTVFSSCSSTKTNNDEQQDAETSTEDLVEDADDTENEKGYEKVVELCCQAVNEKDLSLLDDVLYEGLGEEWNEEHILENISDRFTYEKYQQYLPASPDIDSVEMMPIDEFNAWFYEATGIEIDMEEYCVVESDDNIYSDIGLFKVEGQWYILTFDSADF